MSSGGGKPDSPPELQRWHGAAWDAQVGLFATAVLAPAAWRNLRLQVDGAGGEHAELNHWLGGFLLTLLLVLAATRRPGWRTLGIITGITFLYLGLAALAVPDADGSWGVAGGALALLTEAGYIAATRWETRREAPVSPSGGAS